MSDFKSRFDPADLPVGASCRNRWPWVMLSAMTHHNRYQGLIWCCALALWLSGCPSADGPQEPVKAPAPVSRDTPEPSAPDRVKPDRVKKNRVKKNRVKLSAVALEAAAKARHKDTRRFGAMSQDVWEAI